MHSKSSLQAFYGLDYEEVLDERLWVTVQFRLQALSAVVTSELASIDDH
jgi:hypothetical protein